MTCQGAFAEGPGLIEGGVGGLEGRTVKVEPSPRQPPKVLLSQAPLLKMTAGDIRRYVTARTSIFRILRSATASGVTAKDLVATVLSAGVSPADLIYMATVEGYPTDVVVTEAIIAGVSAEVVFRSAIAAGAKRGAVARAMAELGASPQDVADAAAKGSITKDTLP